jgi:F-type H+-transporting ATPase subunit delta
VTSSETQNYAQALYDTLLSKGLDQLRAVEPKVSTLNPKAKDIQNQIESALPPDTLPEVKNFLLVLVKEDALDQLSSIVKALESYGKGEAAPVDAEVISAITLNATQQKRITDTLRTRYQTPLDLHFTVDESLIGGLVIRVGDQVLDNSLRTRLGVIQRNMLMS